MSKKLLRQLTLARCIPHRPYKLTASQLQVKLEEEGIHVSLRTVQRDLEEMSGMGLFDLTSDERSKPHGWCFERHGLNDFANIMPLSLAVALKTWSDQASQLLPASVLTELNPLVDKASQVIRDSQSELAERWLESVHQSPRPFAGNPEIRRSTLIRDALWRGRKFSADIQRVIKSAPCGSATTVSTRSAFSISRTVRSCSALCPSWIPRSTASRLTISRTWS